MPKQFIQDLGHDSDFSVCNLLPPQTILNMLPNYSSWIIFSFRSPKGSTLRKYTAWHTHSTPPINASLPSVSRLESLRRPHAAYRIKYVFHLLSHLLLIGSDLVFHLIFQNNSSCSACHSQIKPIASRFLCPYFTLFLAGNALVYIVF